MQKRLFKFAASLFTMLMAVGFVACSSDPEVDTPKEEDDPNGPNNPTEYALEIQTKEIGATTVTFEITSKEISKVHYFVDEGASLTPTELLIASKGNEIKLEEEGTTMLTISGFQANKLYAVHFAGTKSNDDFYGEVLRLEFTTANFEGEITFFDIEQRSFKVHVNFPEAVKERGNVLKWGICDAMIYKTVAIHADALNRHDTMGTWFDDSKTFTFDNSEENSYPIRDGKPDYDAWLYEPIVPGQPTYFMVGEFEYVKEGELGYDYQDKDGDWLYGDYTAGWHEPGWYHALFDYYNYTGGNEMFGGGPHDPKLQSVVMGSSPLAEEIFTDQHKFWSGYYRVFHLRTALPEKLDGQIEIDDSGLKPNGGIIRLTPSENVGIYLAGIFTDETWEIFLNSLPDREPETIQWGMTTSMAFQSHGVIQLSGETDLNPNDIWLYPDTDTRYRLVLIGMGKEVDEFGVPTGEKQFYQEHFYRLPKPTKGAPTLTVKAIEAPEGEETSPYELWYNVKCTSGDAVQVKYAYDVKHAWDQAMLSYSASEIIAMGQYFTPEEIIYINSDKGLSFKFTQLQPDKTYGLGVMCWNDEGTASIARYVESTTSAEELPVRSESSLFSDLQGDWLISADYSYTVHNNETGEDKVITERRETPVHIGDLIFDRRFVTDAVYDKFATSKKNKMTAEQVDAQLDQIESTFAAFNEKTRNYNRLSCQGYDLYPIPPYYNYSATAYISPETLFVAASADSYTYIDAAGLLYDFGPKWYLEIDTEGNVTVPFNITTMDPALGYSGLHLMGVNSTNLQNMAMLMMVDGQTGHFPVEVSADKNTITILPLEYEGEKFYPHLVSLDGSCSAFIQSEITLRRSTTATAARRTRQSLQQPATLQGNTLKLKGERATPATRGRSITSIEKMSLKPYKQVSISVLTPDQTRENQENYLKSRR